MKIDNQNNLAFKTNIRVVSPNRFRNIIVGLYGKGPLDEIVQFDIVPEIKNPIFKAFATKVKNIYTKNIRTCTGVLVANKGKEASLFGHFYNSPENVKDTEILEPFMKGTNAILVGSKDQFYYSSEVFDTFKEKIKKRNIPMTIMKSLNPDYEANIAYTSEDDELILCVKNAFKPKEYVHDMTELKKVFRMVKISPTDTIQFDTKQKPKLWERCKVLFKFNSK